MSIFIPNLKNIGNDLNVAGNKEVSESNFPNLEVIGKNLIAYQSGFTRLPPKIKEIGGDVIISDLDKPEFLKDLKRAKRNGIIKGNIFCLILNLK